jgi:hypothetical protein
MDAGRTGRAPAWAGRRIETLALACLLALVAMKLGFAVFAPPQPDETYYWLWGQHLDWSYFDHPPLQAWVQAAFSAAFGNSVYAMRLPPLLATVGIGATVLWWVRLARRAGWDVSPVMALSVFFAAPMMLIFTTIAFPDYLVVLLLGISGALFLLVLDGVAERGTVLVAPLFAAALALGLAALSKYNAALFGVAVAVTILAYRPFRPILRSPHLYLAALLSIACLLPVLWWNVANDWASFRFHLGDRLGLTTSPRAVVDRLWTFLINLLLGFGPFVTAAIWVLASRRTDAGRLANWRALALGTLAVPTLFWIGLSVLVEPAAYWNIIACVVFLPLAVLWFPRSWVVVCHLLVGLIVTAVHVVNYTVMPISRLGANPDREADTLYGWPQVVEAVERQRAATGADFVVTSTYRTAALLAFWTGDIEVQAIAPRADQFDIWRDGAALAGRDAIVLTDDLYVLLDDLAGSFASLEPLEVVTATRFGYPIRNYQIMLGRGFRAAP